MLQRYILGLAFAIAASTTMAATPAPAAQKHIIGVRVGVDAAGKVTSAQPRDPAAIAALNQAATEIARKLTFDPATKDGVATPSETSLFMLLALEPKANGQFGIRLEKALSGPDRSKAAPVITPKYQQRGDASATIVVMFDVRADGSVDPDSVKPESVELKVKSSFAEKRYLDAIIASLRDSQFLLDKVAGTDVPARVSMPYKFGAGGERRRMDEGDDEAKAGDAAKKPAPEMHAESLVPGITLPKVRFTAPAAPATPPPAK